MMNTIIKALIFFAIALPITHAQPVETVVHGQPRQNLKYKMRAITLVAAPFLDMQVNVLDIFPWLEEETRKADPDGTGITFEVRIDDPRSPESRNTMASWKDGQYKFATFPQVHRPTAEQYLIYLTKMANLTYTIKADRVIIEKAK